MELTPPAGSEPWPPAPPRRRHRGLFWAAVLVSSAALVVGAVVAVTSYLGASQPGGVVRSYLAAVARSDAPAALAYGDLPDGPRDWLTSDVLRAQNAVGQLSGVSVLSVDRHGTTRKVTVRYTLALPSGPRSVTDTISVTKEGRTWRLTRVAVPVHVDVVAAAAYARFAGAGVPSGTVLLFPGALPVTFTAPALTVTADHQVVRFAAPDLISAEVTVTPTARQQIVQAATTDFAACLAGQAKVAALCPTPTVGRAVPGSLRGTATSPVADALQISVTSDRIDISGTVAVDGKYEELDFNNQAVDKQGTQKVTLSGYSLPSAPTRIIWGTAS